jgi:hypothetical protein
MDARRQWVYLAGIMALGTFCLLLLFVAEGLRHVWVMMVLGG